MAGGIDWFRWHHGSVTDPKFQLVARKAGASLPDVLAVWAYVLEQASASADRGLIGDIDAEALDCLFGFPNTENRTADILTAMGARKLIESGRIAAWDKRQPKREREDFGAADRKRNQRERDAAAQNQSEPLEAKQGDVTPRHATSRQETPRGEERREEKKEDREDKGEIARKRAPALSRPEGVTEQTWRDWSALRTKKKAPITQTVLDEAKRECVKASLSLERFLQIWCMRGSQGLQADWIKPEERGSPRAAGNKHTAAAAAIFDMDDGYQPAIRPAEDVIDV
jgi:hypothetical protein